MLQFISMEEAFGEIEKRASRQSLPTELVPLEEAVGRVLAEPAVAKLSIPPFDNSARDESFYQLSISGTRGVRSVCRASRR